MRRSPLAGCHGLSRRASRANVLGAACTPCPKGSRRGTQKRVAKWFLGANGPCRFRAHFLLLLLLALSCTLSACASGGGTFAVRSSTQPLTLRGDFDTAVYSFDGRNNVNVLLLEGPADDPSQVVHIRMHWMPRAGSTPVDPSATNASVRYLIFTEEAAGMYSGAGFLSPRDGPGGERFTAALRSAALRLEDRTEDFNDRLGVAHASGSFSARHAPHLTARLLRMVQVRLQERLGYPRFVQRRVRYLRTPIIPRLPNPKEVRR